MTGLNIAYQLIPCSIHVIKPDQWPMISSLEKKMDETKHATCCTQFMIFSKIYSSNSRSFALSTLGGRQ